VQNSNVQVVGNVSVGSALLTVQDSDLTVSGDLVLGENSTLELKTSSPNLLVYVSGTAVFQGSLVLNIENVDLLDFSKDGQYTQVLISAGNFTGMFGNVSVLLQTSSASACTTYSGSLVYSTSFSILITRASHCSNATGLPQWQIVIIVMLSVLVVLITGVAVFFC